jgi:hypothetical protein
VNQLAKLLGFWPPIVYATVAYTLFHLLDKNAAPKARRALTEWFAGPKYEKENVAALILYAFDRIYTPKLFSLKAFLISAALSTLATVLVAYQLYPIVWTVTWYSPEMRFHTFTQLGSNIAADYISLFFIRRWLALAGQRPLMALTTAPVIGVLIVIIVYLIHDVGGFSLATRTFHLSYFVDDFYNWSRFLANAGVRRALLLPAVVVHLWLPLFAIGVLLAQLLNSMKVAGRFSQWFFSGGKAHPFRSVGAIAAAVTFIFVGIGMFIGLERGTPDMSTPKPPAQKVIIIDRTQGAPR